LRQQLLHEARIHHMGPLGLDLTDVPQGAQKSPARPVGFFCGEDGGTSAAAFPLSAAAQAAEPPLNLPTWTWPNDSKS
jgi:hypothetical protein